MSRPRWGFVTDRPYRNVDVGALEGLGIDSLWVAGHLSTGRPTTEAVTALAFLAARCERVTVGTAILLLPLYQPTMLAKQLSEIDRAADGRLLLGIGVGGEYPDEFAACAVSLADRGFRTDEAIDVLRALWSGREVSHAGRYFRFPTVSIDPPPVSPGGPPVIVAGRKAPAMSRAARLGDGWLPYLYSPERYARSVRQITDLADAHGRDLSTFRWMAFVFVSVHADPRVARSNMVAHLNAAYGQPFDDLVDHVAVAGSSTHVIERLQAFADAGVQHFVVCPCGDDLVGTAAAFMADVAPFVSLPEPIGG